MGEIKAKIGGAELKVDENGHEVVAMWPHEYEALREEIKAKTLALRNVLMLARRLKRGKKIDDAMDHMIRFCREAGVEPTILRGGPRSATITKSSGLAKVVFRPS
jgi:hypothetical protein